MLFFKSIFLSIEVLKAVASVGRDQGVEQEHAGGVSHLAKETPQEELEDVNEET